MVSQLRAPSPIRNPTYEEPPRSRSGRGNDVGSSRSLGRVGANSLLNEYKVQEYGTIQKVMPSRDANPLGKNDRS